MKNGGIIGRNSSFLYILSGAKFGMRDATQTKFEASVWFPGAGGWRALGGLGQLTTVPGTKKLQLISRCETQGALQLYKDCRPLPSLR